MQSFPIPYWPQGTLPRTAPSLVPGHTTSSARRAAARPGGVTVGPTLMFSGVALAILGTATLLATCIASFG